MEYSLKAQIKPLTAIAPAAISAATDGVIIDSMGFESMNFVIALGAVAASTTLKLEHGDEADLSDKADVTAFDIVGEVPAIVTGDANGTKWFSYIGKKRYVRLSVASGDATIGAVAVMGHPYTVPTE